MEIVKYRNYRQFLSDSINRGQGSVDSFVEEIGNSLGRNALYKIISKDRAGKFKGSYSISLDSWAEVLGQLKLNQKDLTHLLLLQVEESLGAPSENVKKVQRALKKLIKLNSYTRVNDKPLSPSGYFFAKVFDELPQSIQKKIVLEVESNIVLYMDKSTSNPLREKVKTLLAELT